MPRHKRAGRDLLLNYAILTDFIVSTLGKASQETVLRRLMHYLVACQMCRLCEPGGHHLDRFYHSRRSSHPLRRKAGTSATLYNGPRAKIHMLIG